MRKDGTKKNTIFGYGRKNRATMDMLEIETRPSVTYEQRGAKKRTVVMLD